MTYRLTRQAKSESEENRLALLNEALERGRNSPVSAKTVDEIWDSALLKAKVKKDKPQRETII